MKAKINTGSFITALLCIVLFFSVATSQVIHFFTSTFGIHPFYIVLSISLIMLLFGVIGFSGINGWKSMLRSIVTLFLTLVLSLIIIIIMIMGNLFQFT